MTGTAGTVLVARLDSDGDVLLAGPAVRAVAASAGRVIMLVGPRGRQAADLLPGVDEVLCWSAPWIERGTDPPTRADVDRIVDRLAARRIDQALVLTSFHQSPLPTALLLRMAGVGRVAAISDDFPGALLDVRHRVTGDPPEAERALSLAVAAGFALPPGDRGDLAVVSPLPDPTDLVGPEPYVVAHPGSSVPARAWPPERCAAAVRLLTENGYRVVVTGGTGESALTGYVAGGHGLDLGGRTTFGELAAVLAGARAVVVGNTGPAHLAAAVNTPVVSLFAPTVPAARWAPYRVPHRILGDQRAACRDTRAEHCPVPGHPCLNVITPWNVLAAVRELAGPARAPVPAARIGGVGR